MKSLRTRDFIAISLVTLVVVGVTSLAHLAQVSRLHVQHVSGRAAAAIQVVLKLARTTLATPDAGDARAALRRDADLKELMEAEVAHFPSAVYLLISDSDGQPILASDEAGHPPLQGDLSSLDELESKGPFDRLLAIYSRGAILELAVPLELDDRPFGAARLAVDTSLIRAELNKALANSAAVALSGLALSWVVALIVAKMAGRSIQRISRGIDHMRRGDFEFEVTGQWHDEFRHLASQLHLLSREIRSERLKLIGRQATFEQVMDCLQDAVLIITSENEIAFYNKALDGMVGAPLEEKVGMTLEDALDDSHPLLELVQDVRATTEDVQRMSCRLPVEGRFEESTVSVILIPEPGAPRTGDSETIVVLIEDLGPLRLLMEITAYGADMAEVGQTTAGVVHDVKNPLHAITLHLEILKRQIGGMSRDVARTFDVLRREISSLDNMVQGFLQFVRPSELVKREFDFGEVLLGAVDLLRPEADERGIAITCDVSDGEVSVLGDKEKLKHVLVNVMRNAFEAMSEGGELTIRATSNEYRLTVSVSDTGVGIPKENQEKVFKLFYTTRESGNGLGLPMVRRIVRQHGGDVELDSEPGRGTMVTIELPLQDAENEKVK